MKTTPTFLRLALLALALLLAFSHGVGFAAPTDDAKASVKSYPLQTCLVTDNDLGSMGDERTFVFEGQEIKICCKPCERKFRRDPERYLKKLQDLVAAQQATQRSG